jgi:very-short-patch-repair endonuclease
MLVIEVDGKIHDFQVEDDLHRENILKSLNLNVLRIKNEEVEDISRVMKKIKEYILRLDEQNNTHPLRP